VHTRHNMLPKGPWNDHAYLVIGDGANKFYTLITIGIRVDVVNNTSQLSERVLTIGLAVVNVAVQPDQKDILHPSNSGILTRINTVENSRCLLYSYCASRSADCYWICIVHWLMRMDVVQRNCLWKTLVNEW
jgi:hypothetical protein